MHGIGQLIVAAFVALIVFSWPLGLFGATEVAKGMRRVAYGLIALFVAPMFVLPALELESAPGCGVLLVLLVGASIFAFGALKLFGPFGGTRDNGARTETKRPIRIHDDDSRMLDDLLGRNH